MTARKLRIVPLDREEPAPSLDYEWQERQRIRSRDWAAVHVAADRRSPLFMPDRVRRSWRG